MKKMGRRSFNVLMILALCLALFAVPTFAGNGDGTGGGNGGNSPLILESATPKDGDTEVSTEGKIELVFSNNVVNMSVSENNKTCFKLLDSENNEVAIDVIMGDDQVDPTVKNNITIQSKTALSENETYRLIISPDLMAKNENKLGNETVISFSTLSTKTNGSSTPMIVLALIIVMGSIGVLITKKNKK